MTPRVLPRSRARVRSCDFSRLWWLLATEAAYQVVLSESIGTPPPWWRQRALMYWRPGFQGLRARARHSLAHKEVIV